MKSDNLRFPTTDRAEIGMDMVLSTKQQCGRGRYWSATEVTMLRKLLADGKTTAEIAHALNRTESAVRNQIWLKGWAGRVVLWTKREDKILREMVPDFTSREIGERLGKSRNAVIGRAHRLELTWTAPEPEPTLPEPEPLNGSYIKAVREFPNVCLHVGCRNTKQPGRDFCAGHLP